MNNISVDVNSDVSVRGLEIRCDGCGEKVVEFRSSEPLPDNLERLADVAVEVVKKHDSHCDSEGVTVKMLPTIDEMDIEVTVGDEE